MAPAANHDELGNLVTASESDLGTARDTSRKYAGVVALFALVAVTIGSVSMYRQGAWMQAETKDADIGEIIEACADYTVEATCTAASCNWNGAAVKCEGTPAAGKSARPATRSAAITTIVPMREADQVAATPAPASDATPAPAGAEATPAPASDATPAPASAEATPAPASDATPAPASEATPAPAGAEATPAPASEATPAPAAAEATPAPASEATPAPAGAEATPAPAGNTESYELVVYGISYPDLQVNPTILDKFTTSIKDSVADVIGSGFLPSSVQVVLIAEATRRLAAAWPVAGRRMATPTGTRAKVTVTPSPSMTAAAALATLASNKARLNSLITNKVTAIPNIALVQKGPIIATAGGYQAASELLWWAQHGAKYGFAGKAFPMTAQAANGILSGDSSAGWWLEHGSRNENVQMPR